MAVEVLDLAVTLVGGLPGTERKKNEKFKERGQVLLRTVLYFLRIQIQFLTYISAPNFNISEQGRSSYLGFYI